MAVPLSLGTAPPAATLDAETVRSLADEYLLDSVGDLLEAGNPHRTRDYWTVPILLSNARQGCLGEVGTLRVHAQTGEVLFTPEDREKVRARARTLAASPAP